MPIPERAERIKKALAPVIDELLASGVRLNAHREMHFLFEEDYPRGLPIVLDHLAKPYDDLPKAVMTRALDYTRNKHARAAWPQIAKLYTATPNEAHPFEGEELEVRPSLTKTYLANVLLRLYQPERCAALIELVRDRRNGETRVILLAPLLRVKNRKAGMLDILRDLKKDPQLAIELSAKGVT